MDVKARHGTITENGLVPSRHVFEMISRFAIINNDLPTQKDLMNAIQTAQAEMDYIVSEQRQMTALTREIQPAAFELSK